MTLSVSPPQVQEFFVPPEDLLIRTKGLDLLKEEAGSVAVGALVEVPTALSFVSFLETTASGLAACDSEVW